MQGNVLQFDNFWYFYYLVVVLKVDYFIVNNLGLVNFKYFSIVDLDVIIKIEVEKIFLLQFFDNIWVQYILVEMNFEFLCYDLDFDKFNVEF